MKDLLLGFVPVSTFMALSMDNAPFWERVAEKWGIGFVGLALFGLLAWWTAKREDKLQVARDKRDEAAIEERNVLLNRNNELHEALLKQQEKHAARLEQLIRDGNKAHADVAIEMKNLNRRVQCQKPIQ